MSEELLKRIEQLEERIKVGFEHAGVKCCDKCGKFIPDKPPTLSGHTLPYGMFLRFGGYGDTPYGIVARYADFEEAVCRDCIRAELGQKTKWATWYISRLAQWWEEHYPKALYGISWQEHWQTSLDIQAIKDAKPETEPWEEVVEPCPRLKPSQNRPDECPQLDCAYAPDTCPACVYESVTGLHEGFRRLKIFRHDSDDWRIVCFEDGGQNFIEVFQEEGSNIPSSMDLHKLTRLICTAGDLFIACYMAYPLLDINIPKHNLAIGFMRTALNKALGRSEFDEFEDISKSPMPDIFEKGILDARRGYFYEKGLRLDKSFLKLKATPPPVLASALSEEEYEKADLQDGFAWSISREGHPPFLQIIPRISSEIPTEEEVIKFVPQILAAGDLYVAAVIALRDLTPDTLDRHRAITLLKSAVEKVTSPKYYRPDDSH